jgi:hypothetical protein
MRTLSFLLIPMLFAVTACESRFFEPSSDTRIATSTRPGDGDTRPGAGDPPLTPQPESVRAIGIVTEIPSRMGSATFLLEEHPDRPWGATAGPLEAGDKYYVTVTPSTAIRLRDPSGEGRPGTIEDISRGSRAEVWFVGPIRESYPMQGVAGRIAILEE